MKIETKFDIGDELWRVGEDCQVAYAGKIIKITFDANHTNERYETDKGFVYQVGDSAAEYYATEKLALCHGVDIVEKNIEANEVRLQIYRDILEDFKKRMEPYGGVHEVAHEPILEKAGDEVVEASEEPKPKRGRPAGSKTKRHHKKAKAKKAE